MVAIIPFQSISKRSLNLVFDIESQAFRKLYQNFEVGFDTIEQVENGWNKNTPQV